MAGGINKNKHLENATKHVQRGQLDRAVKELQKILDHDPDDIPVRLKCAGLLARVNKAAEALESYDRVADHYVKNGFNARAVAVYELMTKIDPARVDVHMKLGDLYAILMRRVDAMREYQTVAAYFDAKGKPAQSLEVLRKMAEIGPENARVRRKLAELMVQQGQQEEGKAELERLAETLRAKGGRDEELPEVLDRIAALSPGNAGALRAAARAHLERRDPKRALARLQGAFGADPSDPETLSLLAETFLGLRNRKKALAVYRELAKIHDVAGRREERDEVWREVLRIAPDDLEAKEALDAPIPLTELSTAGEEKPLVYQGGGGPARSGPPPMSVSRLLTEAEIYLRYGIKAKVMEYVDTALAKDPDCLASQPRLAAFHRRVLDGEVSVPHARALPAGPPPPPAKPKFVEISVEVSQALAGAAGQADFREELDEAEFFVRQELYEEAISVYRALAARFPKEKTIRAKLRAAESALAGERATGSRSVKRRELDLEMDGVATIDGAEPAPQPQVSVAEVLQEMSGEMDLATGKRSSFELGLTYKDMGLMDEALAAFEKAAANPDRAAEARHQIGLCRIARGDAEGAVKALKKAAGLARPEQRAAIEFSLGNALEAAGRFQEAAKLYRRLLEERDRS